MEEIGKAITEGIAENAVDVIKDSVASAVIHGGVTMVAAAATATIPIITLRGKRQFLPRQRSHALSRMQWGSM